MKIDAENPLLRLNLPAAATVLLACLFSFLPGRVSRTDPNELLSAPDVGDASGAGLLPTHNGLVSFPTELWDDPFKYREQALAALRESDSQSQHYTTVINAFLEQKIAPKQASDDRLNGSPVTSDDTTASNSTASNTAQIDQPRLLVMPIIVQGESYGPDLLDRTQYRHAVENALSLARYSMEFPNRMSYVRIPKLIVHKNDTQSIIDAPIPLKFYIGSASESPTALLVIWVDRRWMGDRPLEVLRQVVDGVLPKQRVNHRGQMSLNIIGPTYSDDLTQMEKEVQRDQQECAELQLWFSELHCGRASLYSPSATAYDSTSNALSVAGIELVRTIGNNRSLVSALVAELQQRWLIDSPMVLFTESGFQSPEGLASSFTSELEKLGYEPPTRVPFLGGIYKKKGVNAQASDVRDYFVRTLSDIGYDNTASKVNRLSTKVVGVFANNADDKLAIIQAARTLFPNATFFTTDMHSRFSDTSNLRFTRNLLVASHFGLSVDVDFQRGSTVVQPPTETISFRDSYQTSLFLATSLAIERFESERSIVGAPDADIQSMWWLAEDGDSAAAESSTANLMWPMVIEIGQTGGVSFAGQSSRATFSSLTRPQLVLAEVRNTASDGASLALGRWAVRLFLSVGVAGLLVLLLILLVPFSSRLRRSYVDIRRGRGIRTVPWYTRVAVFDLELMVALAITFLLLFSHRFGVAAMCLAMAVLAGWVHVRYGHRLVSGSYRVANRWLRQAERQLIGHGSSKPSPVMVRIAGHLQWLRRRALPYVLRHLSSLHISAHGPGLLARQRRLWRVFGRGQWSLSTKLALVSGECQRIFRRYCRLGPTVTAALVGGVLISNWWSGSHFEPLGVYAGISVWPSSLLFVIVCIASSSWLYHFISQDSFPWLSGSGLKLTRHGVRRHLEFQSDLSETPLKATDVLDLCWTEDPDKAGGNRYRIQLSPSGANGTAIPVTRSRPQPGSSLVPRLLHARLDERLRNSLFYMRSLSAIAFLAIMLITSPGQLPFSPPPARGDFAIVVTFFAKVLAVLLIFLMVGHCLLQTMTLRRLVEMFKRALQQQEFRRVREIENAKDLLERLENVTFQSARGLWIPSAIILVFACARLPIWDGWPMNTALLSFILLPLAVTIIVALLLRRETLRLRELVLGKLDELKFDLLVPERGSSASAASDNDEDPLASSQLIQEASDKILGLRRGAFSDLWHDPVLGSVLLFITTSITGPGQELFRFLRALAGIG